MESSDLEHLNTLLERDQTVRDAIKDKVADLDKASRLMIGTLSKIHWTDPTDLPALLDTVRPALESSKENFSQLSQLVPPNQFWRFKDTWGKSLQTIIFCAALVTYLADNALISLAGLNLMFGIEPEIKDRFNIPVEDYLHGLISLVNELSRLAVNSVTMGDFQRPIQISSFVKDLYAGFALLNLKNDNLRKRFDSLKYDMKKIEEIVYDVSLRRLNTKGPALVRA